MTKASDNPFPSLLVQEAANDGSDFGNPAADYRRLFLGEDGLLHLKDSAGTVTDIGAATTVATDAIWDAAGDLAVGSGANTAAKLAIGAANTVPKSNGTTLAYVLPPGHEFSYVEDTDGLSVTATSEATANTLVTAAEVTFDGSTVVVIEFFVPYSTPASDAAARSLSYWLYDGASSIGRMAVQVTPAAATDYKSVYAQRRLTPSAAAHTYSIRCSVSAGTGTITSGVGGSGAQVPAFIRITKV